MEVCEHRHFRRNFGGDYERDHLPRRTHCRDHGCPFVLRPALRARAMPINDPVMSDRVGAPLLATNYVQWGPVIAGAFTAAALATVLHAFAGAIGLAVSSAAPTWRDAS